MSDGLDLDKIEAMCAAATEGPWLPSGYGFNVISQGGKGPSVCQLNDPVWQRANSLFIAQSRTLIPALVARVRELEELLRRALDSEEDWGDVKRDIGEALDG